MILFNQSPRSEIHRVVRKENLKKGKIALMLKLPPRWRARVTSVNGRL
jgi:hypothetical protein